MPVKHLGLVAIGIATGLGISLLVQRVGESEVSGEQPDRMVAAESNSNDVAALRAQYDRQLAELKRENEALRARADTDASTVRVPIPRTPAEQLAFVDEVRKTRAAAAEQRDTDRLLSAGFSKDRIEWLRNRSEELQARQRQADAARRQQGLPPEPVKMLAYLFHPDLDLRYEIGDDEYEKYLSATGRSTGVNLSEVLRGSIAETAGLKPGDEVVAYANKRVFNLGELSELSRDESRPGSVPVSVSVKRDGQLIQLVAQPGDLGIRSSLPLPPPVGVPKPVNAP